MPALPPYGVRTTNGTGVSIIDPSLVPSLGAWGHPYDADYVPHKLRLAYYRLNEISHNVRDYANGVNVATSKAYFFHSGLNATKQSGGNHPSIATPAGRNPSDTANDGLDELGFNASGVTWDATTGRLYHATAFNTYYNAGVSKLVWGHCVYVKGGTGVKVGLYPIIGCGAGSGAFAGQNYIQILKKNASLDKYPFDICDAADFGTAAASDVVLSSGPFQSLVKLRNMQVVNPQGDVAYCLAGGQIWKDAIPTWTCSVDPNTLSNNGTLGANPITLTGVNAANPLPVPGEILYLYGNGTGAGSGVSPYVASVEVLSNNGSNQITLAAYDPVNHPNGTKNGDITQAKFGTLFTTVKRASFVQLMNPGEALLSSNEQIAVISAWSTVIPDKGSYTNTTGLPLVTADSKSRVSQIADGNSANIVAVRDCANVGCSGMWRKVSNTTECEAYSGTWTVSGGNLYVHPETPSPDVNYPANGKIDIERLYRNEQNGVILGNADRLCASRIRTDGVGLGAGASGGVDTSYLGYGIVSLGAAPNVYKIYACESYYHNRHAFGSLAGAWGSCWYTKAAWGRETNNIVAYGPNSGGQDLVTYCCGTEGSLLISGAIPALTSGAYGASEAVYGHSPNIVANGVTGNNFVTLSGTNLPLNYFKPGFQVQFTGDATIYTIQSYNTGTKVLTLTTNLSSSPGTLAKFYPVINGQQCQGILACYSPQAVITIRSYNRPGQWGGGGHNFFEGAQPAFDMLGDDLSVMNCVHIGDWIAQRNGSRSDALQTATTTIALSSTYAHPHNLYISCGGEYRWVQGAPEIDCGLAFGQRTGINCWDLVDFSGVGDHGTAQCFINGTAQYVNDSHCNLHYINGGGPRQYGLIQNLANKTDTDYSGVSKVWFSKGGVWTHAGPDVCSGNMMWAINNSPGQNQIVGGTYTLPTKMTGSKGIDQDPYMQIISKGTGGTRPFQGLVTSNNSYLAVSNGRRLAYDAQMRPRTGASGPGSLVSDLVQSMVMSLGNPVINVISYAGATNSVQAGTAPQRI